MRYRANKRGYGV